MTYKQIEACREVRLWIGQVIVPAATAATLVYFGNPKVKNFVDSKIDNVKAKFKSRKIKAVKIKVFK